MQFSPEQLDLVIRAMDEAEERTTRYYCIPPHKWQLLRYDLLTCQNHEWVPLPEVILAQVQYFEKEKGKGGLPDFYRIQLNDPTILTVVKREEPAFDLYPFLVYILTHEMVHLVRLSSMLNSAKNLAACCEVEENRVERISRQILTKAGHRNFKPVLERFCAPSHCSG